MLAWRDEHLRAPTVTREMVAAREFELRDLYLDVRDSVLNPAPPVVLNDDGDPLCNVTLIYALSVDVPTARERLLPLATLGAEVHEMEVERDAAGVVMSTDMAWMSRTGKPSRISASSAASPAGPTVLGAFTLGAGRLAVTVDSEKRATAIAGQIRARFEAKRRRLWSASSPIPRRRRSRERSAEADALRSQAVAGSASVPAPPSGRRRKGWPKRSH